MEPSKKSFFVPKNNLFPQMDYRSENGNQLGSIKHVNKKEPITQGTTWNHLKNGILFKNDLFHQAGLKAENGNQLGSI